MPVIDKAREHCRFVGNETENPAAANVKGPLETVMRQCELLVDTTVGE